MRRYTKQRPKIDIKPGPIVKISETTSGSQTFSTFSINIQGLNRSGKKAVKAMDEKIKADKNNKPA